MNSSEYGRVKAFLAASAKGSYDLAALALSVVEQHRETLMLDGQLLKLTVLFMCGSISRELMDNELKNMLSNNI